MLNPLSMVPSQPLVAVWAMEHVKRRVARKGVECGSQAGSHVPVADLVSMVKASVVGPGHDIGENQVSFSDIVK